MPRLQVKRLSGSRLGRIGCVLALSIAAVGAAPAWWKGNLHTHSLWSDGDDFPEMIVAWYQQHGYHFLALSDHNRMLVGQHWVDTLTNRGGPMAFEKYVAKFGTNIVETRPHDGRTEVRLRTLEQFRNQFEKPGSFLLIPGEEISDKFDQLPIHLNATNLRDLIKPQGGSSVAEVIQNDVNAVLEQRQRTGTPMIPHINHPNFIWALTAEDIVSVQGDRFLEIYNGHPVTKNEGDAEHASAERIWDIVLTRRLAELKLEPIWGTAVDDSHNYHQMKVGHSNPGRGWLMVRASELTPASIIDSLEKGEFYASSGVRLKDVRRGPKRLAIEIEGEAGITYTTQFIGTRKGYDPKSEPVMKDGKPVRATRRYSPEIGKLLAEVKGTSPVYELKGDEIYVRARVISSKLKENPTVKGDFESAWVQPLIPGKP